MFVYAAPWLGNAAEGEKFAVKDYSRHLNAGYPREKRNSTLYIIVHTSEAGLTSTLRTLSKGKKIGKNYRTSGGHAHYAIARNGHIYRILNHIYRADHAGLSMWDGTPDISSCSLGIELVGYHYDEITGEQYLSLSLLLDELQQIYKIPDKNVLTHCQVSYGDPNRWFKKAHRGRKRCALNFDRRRAGLKDFWTYDPDVRTGRLAADLQIYKIFYSKEVLAALRTQLTTPAAGETASTGVTEETGVTGVTGASGEFGASGASGASGVSGVSGTNAVGVKTVTNETIGEEIAGVSLPGAGGIISNIIGPDNTAWNIAGEDYDQPETLYILPGSSKRTISGDLVDHLIGWDKLPTGTQVLVNQPVETERQAGPVFEINRDYTAWTIAGAAYRSPGTMYFLPRKKNNILPGNKIRDWDALPTGTKVIIGYRGPLLIQAAKGKTAWGLAGKAHNSKDTIYYIPGQDLVTGDQVADFGRLPRGTKIFIKE